MRLLLRVLVAATCALASCDEGDSPSSPSPSVDAGLEETSSPVNAASADAGEGAADADPFGNRNGTRIRLRNFTTAEGFRRSAGFFDKQTGEPCNVRQLAQDGVRRCLPAGSAISHFADASCTQPVASYTSCASKPKFAAETVPAPDGCSTAKTRIYNLGAEFGAPSADGGPAAVTLYTKSGASCVSTPPAANTIYVATTTEAPPADFVAFHETRLPVGDALNAVYYDGDEGSRLFATFEDKAGATPCTFAPMSDGTLRCAPSSLNVSALFDRYSDGACKSELAFASCPASAKLARRTGLACPNVTRFYELGANVPSDAGIFYKGAGSCITAPPIDGFAPRELGAEVLPSVFQDGTLGPWTAAGRLASRKIVIDGVAVPVATETFERKVDIQDTAKNAPCAVQLASDGVYRCLPDAALASYFTDATCTQRLAFTYVSNCASAPAYATYTGPECPGLVVVLAVTGKRAGTSVYVKGTSTCSVADLGANVELWDVGAVIAPSEFAEMSLTVD